VRSSLCSRLADQHDALARPARGRFSVAARGALRRCPLTKLAPSKIAEVFSQRIASATRRNTSVQLDFSVDPPVAAWPDGWGSTDQLSARRWAPVSCRSCAGVTNFVSRFFAPAVGVDEDPGTGSAHAFWHPTGVGKLSRTRTIGR